MALYFDPDATGANDGTSWTDAYTDLQTALDANSYAAGPLYVRKSGGGSVSITSQIDVDAGDGTDGERVQVIGCDTDGSVNGTRVVFDGGGGSFHLFYGDVAYQMFSNCRFTNVDTSGNQAFRLGGSGDQWFFVNCEFDNAYYGVYDAPNNSTVCTYIGCDFHDCYRGLSRACTANLYLGCRFYDNSNAALYTVYRVTFVFCQFYRNGVYGITGAGQATLIACALDNNGIGFEGNTARIFMSKFTNHTKLAELDSGYTFFFGVGSYGNSQEVDEAGGTLRDYLNSQVALAAEGYADKGSDDYSNSEIEQSLYNLFDGLSSARAADMPLGLPGLDGPKMSDVAPTSIAIGETLTVTGNFSASGNSATVGGNSATILTEGLTEITLTIPAGLSPGQNYDLVITDGNSKSVTAPNAVLMGSVASVAIASVTPPTSITAGGGEGVIIGVNFSADNNSVTIDGHACSIVSQSTTRINFLYTADAEGSYALRVTNDDNGSYDEYTVEYADPGTPILTNAEAAVVTLIEGMTEAAGYHYDWGTADQQDQANMTYPAAFCELLPDETNEDDPDGAHASAYLNRASLRIRVWPSQSLAENPVTAVNAVYNKLLDDLKKLFGTGAGSTLSGTVQHIQYLRSQRVNQENGDVETPGHLDTYWSVLYHQDRTYPSVNA